MLAFCKSKGILNYMFRKCLTYVGYTVGGMLLGILLLAFYLAGEIYEFQDSVDGTHLPPVDVIVCLAGGRGRISAAGDLWFRYYEQSQGPAFHPPELYISGMGHESRWPTFARQLRRGVRDIIKPEQVILETDSTNTEENAHYFARLAVEHRWKRVLLFTSSYHMKRARYVFEHALKEDEKTKSMVIDTLSLIQDPFAPGEWRTSFYGIRVTLFEYLKWIYYKATFN